MLLDEYLDLFRKAIAEFEKYGYADSVEIREEIRANKQAILNAKVVLIDNSILHIKEYIDAKYGINRVSYAYQYQDRVGRLIFRYDNAAHRPALGFNEHKHSSDGTIYEAVLPDIFDLVDEIVSHL
jgi:predicted AlkP superfamily phosphohydrolase/phosphomutase